jgi:hypothetical protein
VLQGAFIIAKAKDNVKDAAACVDHLRRYVELLFQPPSEKGEGTMTVRTLANREAQDRLRSGSNCRP